MQELLKAVLQENVYIGPQKQAVSSLVILLAYVGHIEEPLLD